MKNYLSVKIDQKNQDTLFGMLRAANNHSCVPVTLSELVRKSLRFAAAHDIEEVLQA